MLRHHDVGPKIKRVLSLARSIASTGHIRLRSLDRNGPREKHENVNEWACPGSLNRRHVFRCPFMARRTRILAEKLRGDHILP